MNGSFRFNVTDSANSLTASSTDSSLPSDSNSTARRSNFDTCFHSSLRSTPSPTIVPSVLVCAASTSDDPPACCSRRNLLALLLLVLVLLLSLPLFTLVPLRPCCNARSCVGDDDDEVAAKGAG